MKKYNKRETAAVIKVSGDKELLKKCSAGDWRSRWLLRSPLLGRLTAMTHLWIIFLTVEWWTSDDLITHPRLMACNTSFPKIIADIFHARDYSSTMMWDFKSQTEKDYFKFLMQKVFLQAMRSCGVFSFFLKYLYWCLQYNGNVKSFATKTWGKKIKK